MHRVALAGVALLLWTHRGGGAPAGAQAARAADTSASHRRPSPLPPLPATGLDFSAADAFWIVADTLLADIVPSSSLWRSTLATPGYRLYGRDSSIKHLITAALMPSRQSERDSILLAGGNNAASLGHVLQVASLHADLVHFRDSLATEGSAILRAAVARAARFLPPGTTEGKAPPLVAFAVFGADGYSQDSGVVIDLLWLRGARDLTDILAHEFHHSFVARLTRVTPPPNDSADAPLVRAIVNLRNEGIADQIDKPYPLVVRDEELREYAVKYNAAYERTPAILQAIDELLRDIADHPSTMRTNAQRVRDLLPYSGHPNGAFVARRILQTFGVDSLMPAIRNPFALIRTYAWAERARGAADPLSPKALSVLDAEERRYLR